MAVVVAMAISCFSHTASATIWDITAVQSGSGGGFGFSGIHAATPASPMSGTNLVTITGAGSLGHYDDVTGELTATFDLSGTGIDAGSTMTITMFGADTMFFTNPNGTLSSPARVNVDFDINFTGAATALQMSRLVDGVVGFKEDFVCCGSNGNDPNSFHANGDDRVMSLWGGTGFNIDTQTYPGATFGMDLRLDMVAYVPEPMTGALFGLGLAGLGLMRRRSSGQDR